MHNLTSENYTHHAGLSVIKWHAEPNHDTREGWVIVVTGVNVAGCFIDGARLTSYERFTFGESVRLGDKDYDDDHFDRLALRYWKEFHEDEADDARRKTDH